MRPHLVSVLTQKTGFGSTGYQSRSVLSQHGGNWLETLSKVGVAFYTPVLCVRTLPHEIV